MGGAAGTSTSWRSWGTMTREGGGLQLAQKGGLVTPHQQILKAIPVKCMVLGPCCCLSEELVIFQGSNRIIVENSWWMVV